MRKPGKRQRAERAAIRRGIRFAEGSLDVTRRLRGAFAPMPVIVTAMDVERLNLFTAGFNVCLDIFRSISR